MPDSFSSDGPEIPTFTGGDVVRLFAATYLPLCRALHREGLIDSGSLARRILLSVRPEDGSPSAALAHALANVLRADAEAGEPG